MLPTPQDNAPAAPALPPALSLDDPGVQALRAQTLHALQASLNQMVADVRRGLPMPEVQRAFIARHTTVLHQAYLAARRLGAVRYFAQVSHTPDHWADALVLADPDTVRDRLTFYAAGSVHNLASQVAQAQHDATLDDHLTVLHDAAPTSQRDPSARASRQSSQDTKVFYSPSQPRDPHGRWTGGGGGRSFERVTRQQRVDPYDHTPVFGGGHTATGRRAAVGEQARVLQVARVRVNRAHAVLVARVAQRKAAEKAYDDLNRVIPTRAGLAAHTAQLDAANAALGRAHDREGRADRVHYAAALAYERLQRAGTRTVVPSPSARQDALGQHMPFSHQDVEMLLPHATATGVASINQTRWLALRGTTYLVKTASADSTEFQGSGARQARNEAATIAGFQAMGYGHLVAPHAYDVIGQDGTHHMVIERVAGDMSEKYDRGQMATHVAVRELQQAVLGDYLLQVGDRHRDNLLYDDQGHHVHEIDFGESLSPRLHVSGRMAVRDLWELRSNPNPMTLDHHEVQSVLAREPHVLRALDGFSITPEERAGVVARFDILRNYAARQHGGPLYWAGLASDASQAENARHP